MMDIKNFNLFGVKVVLTGEGCVIFFNDTSKKYYKIIQNDIYTTFEKLYGLNSLTTNTTYLEQDIFVNRYNFKYTSSNKIIRKTFLYKNGITFTIDSFPVFGKEYILKGSSYGDTPIQYNSYLLLIGEDRSLILRPLQEIFERTFPSVFKKEPTKPKLLPQAPPVNIEQPSSSITKSDEPKHSYDLNDTRLKTVSDDPLEYRKLDNKYPSVMISLRESHTDFINKLPKEDSDLLKMYTRYGDKVINTVLRQSGQTRNYQVIPYIKRLMQEYGRLTSTSNVIDSEKSVLQKSKENLDVGVIRTFIYKFNNLARRIPVLQTEINVYRGIVVDYIFKGTDRDFSIDTNELLSTTYEKGIAKTFKPEEFDCCMLNITVKPGVRVLNLEPISKFPYEREILIFPPFKILKKEEDSQGEFNVVIGPPSKTLTGSRRTYRHKKQSKKTRKLISYL